MEREEGIDMSSIKHWTIRDMADSHARNKDLTKLDGWEEFGDFAEMEIAAMMPFEYEDVEWHDLTTNVWGTDASVDYEIHLEPEQAWRIRNVLTGQDHLNPPYETRAWALAQLTGEPYAG